MKDEWPWLLAAAIGIPLVLAGYMWVIWIAFFIFVGTLGFFFWLSRPRYGAPKPFTPVYDEEGSNASVQDTTVIQAPPSLPVD